MKASQSLHIYKKAGTTTRYNIPWIIRIWRLCSKAWKQSPGEVFRHNDDLNLNRKIILKITYFKIAEVLSIKDTRACQGRFKLFSTVYLSLLRGCMCVKNYHPEFQSIYIQMIQKTTCVKGLRIRMLPDGGCLRERL